MITCIDRRMEADLKDHVLEQVLDTEKFQSFYMKRPGGGRVMSTLITFTPEGIVIQGDLTPGRHGNVSCLGYGLGWFRGQLSGSYLAEKFLQQGWYTEVAVVDLREFLKNIADGNEEAKPGDVEKIQELIKRCEDGDIGTEGFREAWEDIYEDWCWDWSLGWGYNPTEHSWLCVIQQRFAALYNAANEQDR